MAGNKITWLNGYYDPDTYYIYRSSTPIDPTNLPSPIATLPRGSSSYVDNDNITEGDVTYYRVDAEKNGFPLFGKNVKQIATNSFLYYPLTYTIFKRSSETGELIDSVYEERYGSSIRSMTVSENNNIYIGSSSGRLTKTDLNGNVIWTTEKHSQRINSIAVNPTNDYVYTASDDEYVRKYESTGNSPVAHTHNDDRDVVDVDFDNNGNIYSVNDGQNIVKTDFDGILQWKQSTGNSYNRSISVDPVTGDVYVGMNNDQVKKYDTDANYDWTFTGHNDPVYSVFFDPVSQYVYTGSDDGTVRKLDTTNGNEVWQADINSGIHSVIVDSNGNVYAGGRYGRTAKIDSSGTVVWTVNDDSGNTIQSIGISIEGS